MPYLPFVFTYISSGRLKVNEIRKKYSLSFVVTLCNLPQFTSLGLTVPMLTVACLAYLAGVKPRNASLDVCMWRVKSSNSSSSIVVCLLGHYCCCCCFCEGPFALQTSRPIDP